MDHQRSLEITIVSAKGLKKVKHLSKMDVYVAVKLSGDPNLPNPREQRTHVAKDGGTNPAWTSCVMNFVVNETLASTANRLVITFEIICVRKHRGDKNVGEAHVPVEDLWDGVGFEKTAARFVTYKVRKPSGKPRGEISFTYRFGEKVPAGAAIGGISSYGPPVSNLPAGFPVLAQVLPGGGSFNSSCPPVYPPAYPILPISTGYNPAHPMPPAAYPSSRPVRAEYPPMTSQWESPSAGYPAAHPWMTPPAGYPTGSSGIKPVGYPILGSGQGELPASYPTGEHGNGRPMAGYTTEGPGQLGQPPAGYPTI